MKLVKHNVVKTATIEFDNEELEFLAAIMQKIAGRPEGTRGIASRLVDLLENLGFDFEYVQQTHAYKSMDRDRPGIFFKD